MRLLPVVFTWLALIPLVPAAAPPGGEKFACAMSALSKTERARHGELSHVLFAAAQETKELPDGYGFRFAAGELTRAAEWVSLERRCCPFLTFEIEQSRDGGPLWLRVKGTDGVKAFIKAELGL